MARMPSTYVQRHTAFYDEDLPHAEAHQEFGTDPIISPIRFLGSDSDNTFFNDDGSATDFVDTPLSVTFQSRGGKILIMYGGVREAYVANSPSTGISVDVRERAMIDSTELTTYHTYIEILHNPTGDLQELYHTNSDAMIWITDALPGAHTVKIQVSMDADVNFYYSPTIGSTILLVFEILPTGRI